MKASRPRFHAVVQQARHRRPEFPAEPCWAFIENKLSVKGALVSPTEAAAVLINGHRLPLTSVHRADSQSGHQEKACEHSFSRELPERSGSDRSLGRISEARPTRLPLAVAAKCLPVAARLRLSAEQLQGGGAGGANTPHSRHPVFAPAGPLQ